MADDRFPPLRGRVALALAFLALAVGGCGGAAGTPAACLGPTSGWLEALEKAGRDRVLLPDETPISDCLPADQAEADRGRVAMSAVMVATELSGGARRGTRGPDLERDLPREAFESGYLVGALERGAGDRSDASGLVDRVRQAATRFLDARPAAARRAYRAGLAEGRGSG